MKSKIINRVRVREFRADMKRAAEIELEEFIKRSDELCKLRKEMQERIEKREIELSKYAGTYGGYKEVKSNTTHWWKFWK